MHGIWEGAWGAILTGLRLGGEGGEVIALSYNDELEGGGDGGAGGVEVGPEDEEIDIDEWIYIYIRVLVL